MRLEALRQEFEQQLRRNTVTLGSDPAVAPRRQERADR